MGDEFFARLDEGKYPSMEKLIGTLCQTSRYVIEKTGHNEAALRFAHRQRRPDWPEDFTLTIYQDGLLLTIYGSTGSEREQLVKDAESALHFLGIVVSFDEI
jgi:hypothetical protein